MILVTGSTGRVGSEVVKLLVKAKQEVRALVRDPGKTEAFDPAVEVVIGDLSKPETLPRAFAGVDKVFVLVPSGRAIAELEPNAFEASKKAGVRHIVKISGRGIGTSYASGTLLTELHGESERRLKELEIPWTILRPCPFANSVLRWLNKERREIALPTGDGKDTLIDPLDVAMVAARALTFPGHEGKTYEITGPQALSYREIAEKLSAVIGEPIRFNALEENVWRDGMLRAGVPQYAVEMGLRYFRAVKDGQIEPSSTVAEVLGHKGRTFDEWARNNVALIKAALT